MFVLTLITVLAFAVTNVQGKQTVNGIYCVPVTECPAFMKLLKKPVNPSAMSIIKTSSCGFEGLVQKVWCANVETVDDVITTKATRNVSALLPNKCGQHVENKVIGGSETGLDEFPWMALLQYENQENGNKLIGRCGGVLISKRYVLTAAHCISRLGPPVRVVLGEYDINNVTDCFDLPTGGKECSDPPVSLGVESVHIHTGWYVKEGRPFYNDLAMIRLADNVEFTDFIQPICLPRAKVEVTSKFNLLVAGWGVTESGDRSNVKLKVKLPFISSQQCSKQLRRNIGEGQMCAGGVIGKDSCRGDSGGPLMYNDEATDGWTVVGIVSLGIKGCGEGGTPAIYTYVPNYLDWIHHHLRP